MSIRSFLLVVLLVLCCSTARAAAESPSIHGRITDPSGLGLPGVTVVVRQDSGAETSTVSESNGAFEFDGLPPGRYALEASLDGFDTLVRRDLQLSDQPLMIDLQLQLAVVRQEIVVTAPAAANVLGSPEPNAPVAVTREVMDIAMLPNSQFDDVLSLMPNVLRGPDGQIAVAGARSTASGLVVNGLNATDPIFGGSGVMLPLKAVETMQVYSGGAPAEYGGATGGVTAVETRSGTGTFHMALDSFFPRLRYTDTGISGVAFWDPNLGFSGPLAGGRGSYQQGLSYRYDRNSFTTLAGDDHNLYTALMSWTQLDFRVSDDQHLRVSLSADPHSTDRYNITAFTPASSAPRVQQGGWSGGVSDAITAGRALVEFRAAELHSDAAVTPYGTDAYVMSHELSFGDYFDRQDRRASRLEAGTKVTWTPAAGHVVSAGASVDRSALDQNVSASDVAMLRSDGSIARVVSFLPAAARHAESTTAGVFVQDKWSARPWLTINAGVRVDETTRAGDPPVSPRAGWTIGHDDRTTFGGSIGLFADALPLSALAFSGLPARRIVDTDPFGGTTTTVVTNARATDLRVPQALRWDLEMSRRAGQWMGRLRYEERHGRDELVVDPGLPDPDPLLPPATGLTQVSTLESTGTSRSRSLEATAGLRATAGDELYVSYVRSATYGYQNSLDAVEGLLRAPFVQPNLAGPLGIDVPHRVLAWGVFHLPSQLTVAPFVEARSGFPYTAIDDAWRMVGTPNQYRLPWMASLDLSVTRIVSLPHRLPDARVGLKLYNIVSTHTEREVQRDIQRPDFGSAYDPVPRDFSFVFEFLWGPHHP